MFVLRKTWSWALVLTVAALLALSSHGQEVCPPLSLSPHVIPSTHDNSVFTRVYFSCEPGYRRVGDHILTCMVTGFWNHPPPTCEKILICPAIPPLDHMRVNTTNNSVGAVVSVSCDVGYKLRGGASVITCYLDGHWSYYPVYCVNVTCDSFADDPNDYEALITNEEPYTSYIYETVLTYSCEEGYRLIGPSSVTCTANGTWSNNSRYRPYCAFGVWCPSVKLEHGTVSEGDLQHTAPDGSVMLACDQGYGPIRGFFYVNCERESLLTSSWRPHTPACERMCPRVELDHNVLTHPELLELFPGTEMNFTCRYNYILHGNTSSRCVNGSWTTPFPTCTEPVVCPYPSKPQDHLIVVTINGTTPGSIVQFECEQPDWYLEGSATIVCQPQGSWSAPVPHCTFKGSGSHQIDSVSQQESGPGIGAVIGAVVGGVVGVVILIAVVVVVTIVIVILLVKYTDYCIGKPRYRRFEVTLMNDDQPQGIEREEIAKASQLDCDYSKL